MSQWTSSRCALADSALLESSLLAAIFCISIAAFVPTFTHAQAPCGSIIAPINWYIFDSPLTTTPITDCGDPFGVTVDVASPYTLYVNGQAVGEGMTIPVNPVGTQDYRIEGSGLLTESSTFFFRHDGDDYRYIDTRLSTPSESEYRAFAAAFFPSGTDIEPYIETAVSGDFFLDDFEMQQLLYVFLEYVDQHYVPQSPPLRPGTYTLVIKELESVLTDARAPFLGWMREWLVPLAHAQFQPREYTFTVTFTLEEEAEEVGASSILFLPGIQASRLYKDGLLGTEDQLWEPNINQDFRQLEMTDAGESIEEVYTRDIIDETLFGIITIYEGFENFLNGLVTDEIIEDWTPFAYDWRYSVVDIAENGTQYEDEIRDAIVEIESLAEDSFSGKVTLIGHSNGGLLAKALMRRLEAEGKAALVDRIIFIGSPQLGTPKAIPTILHGYDQDAAGGIVISEATVRDIIGNMPGALALTPSQKYFDADPGLLITFDASESTAFLRTAYGNAINDEAELFRFMAGSEGRPSRPTSIEEPVTANETLLTEAFADHASLFDTWVAPEGIEIIEIVGVGLDTLRGVEYREFVRRQCVSDVLLGTTCGNTKYYKAVPRFTQFGDGTVVGYSAEGYAGDKTILYVDLKMTRQLGVRIEHADLTESPYLQLLIKNLITDSGTDIETISNNLPSYAEDMMLVGVHSPASIVVTDTDGKRVERGDGRYPVEEIEGSQYLDFAGGKYVLVPKDGRYNIALKGTGVGSVTFTLEELSGGNQETIVDVRIATVTPSTTITTSFQLDNLANFLIDENGDGRIDIEMTPEGEVILKVVTYADLRTSIQALSLKSLYKKVLLAQVLVASELDRQSAKKPKLTRLEVLALQQLEVTLKSYVRKRLLTQTTINPILDMIKKLKI